MGFIKRVGLGSRCGQSRSAVSILHVEIDLEFVPCIVLC